MVSAVLRTAVGVPTFFLFTLGIAGYVYLVALVRPNSQHIESVIHLWSRLFLSVAPVTWSVEGRDRVDPATQYVFMANHLSNFDIPLLFLAIPNRIRYMAKAELYKIPVLAQAMRRVGIIKIDRQAGRTAHGAINEGVAAAKERGYSLIVFPEGTRSRSNEMKPFKKGAFRIAITNQLPVVPVTLHGTWDIWRPDAKLFFPGKARVVVHDPIPTEGMDVSDIDTLRERTWNIVERTYEELLADAG